MVRNESSDEVQSLAETVKTVAPASAAPDPFSGERVRSWIAVAILVYFGFRLFYYATSISPYVPPDEITHLGKCRIFSTFLFLAENSSESYQYGLVTNTPWLYYWIMGKLLHLNFFGLSDLVFLRLMNIPLAFGTVYYVWRLLKLLTDDRLAQVLLLTAMTNTMMFTFLSASVSYDNLANLLAAMSIYYACVFVRTRLGDALAMSLVCQLAGCLTKNALLPFVLILNILVLAYGIKDINKLPVALRDWFKGSGKRAIVLCMALAIGLVLNAQLYGGNYLRYGKLDPETFDVLPLEQALQYRLAARTHIFDRFREGRLSLEQAFAMANRIEHPGDRADTVYLIENYVEMKNRGIPLMGLGEYLPLWISQMAAGTFGIFGHLQIPNYWPFIAPFFLLALLAVIAFVMRWRPRDGGRIAAGLIIVVLAYSFILLYFVNYRTYRETGAFGMALQGRYIFPVIGPVYVLASCYLMRLSQGRRARLGLLGLAVFIFVISDFPFFRVASTPEWFIRP
ncbi:hypothetical protein [Geobacter sp. SVR]|uniref:hypothetical protein n=1 Tax=Geobacter sp. SVR TaxID=2495594 RepID=UPI00143EFF4D|nr:hypothetical protein [Geobacter sp. SVR]BCS52125.1 hypothetical protein GSVR_04330 [Geobacter sp. SVR]GCF86580.1 hypothetical protein GSbR_31800 [Geobacter sp. SVR]